MADTITFILDYLEKQKLDKAAEALREEIKHKQQAFPGSPRTQPVPTDLDVSLFLKISQDGANSSRLMSASSTGSQDSSTPPPQNSPSSLLPDTHFRSDQETGDELLRSPPAEGATLASGKANAANADAVSPPSQPQTEADSNRDKPAKGSPESGSQASEESPGELTPAKSKSPLPPLPMAEPVSDQQPELPQLRPIRLSAGSKSPSTGPTKLQPLPEVEKELEGEEEEEEDDEEEEGEDEGDDGYDEEEEDEEEEDGEDEGDGEDGISLSPTATSSVSTPSSHKRHQPLKRGAAAKVEKGSPVGSAAESTGQSPRSVGVVPVGDVAVDSQLLGGAESASVGSRKPRGSVSLLAAEQEDSQSVVSLSTDGAVAASEAQDSAWDSDTYDDEDDPGYTRQQIEDEEWFLLHEIEYPTEDDVQKAEQDAVARHASEGLPRSPKGDETPAAPVPAHPAAGSTAPALAGTKEKGKAKGAGGEQQGAIVEDEVYFSGEEYYQQGLEGEPRTPEPINGEGTWASVVGEFKGKKGSSRGKAKQGDEDAEEEEDEQTMMDARSVGVMSSDMADAGSSIRESVQGSDGDVDSLKGVPAGGGAGAKSRLGRSEEVQEGEEDEGQEDEEEDEEDAEKAGSELEVASPGGPEEEGQADATGRSLPTEGEPMEGSRRKSKSLQDQTRASLKERSPEGGTPEFGFRSLSEAGNEQAPEGFGAGGGFSFPSPGSHDGLSRMGSGRSGLSVGEQLGEGKVLADLAAGEEVEALASAADDTLAAWKRHSASSSPMLLSPTKGSDEGRGSAADLTDVQVKVEKQEKKEKRKKGGKREEANDEMAVAVPDPEVAAADPELAALVETKDKKAAVPAGPAVEDAGTVSVAPAASGGEPRASDSKVEEGAKDSKSTSQKTGLESEEFETFNLKIIHRKNRTGFEEEKDFPVVLNSVIAGRYYVTEYLGSAAFSKAIQAHDLHTGMDVCLKIIKNNKDFFDQSLDEVKLLKFVNRHDPADEHHVLRLFDYFYHREHLFIICELLRANLYEFQKYNRESGGEVYFTMPRLQKIAKQVLSALKFMHSLGLIHCDLKPENILIKSYSRCEVKVIDLGSSCFETDHLCSYVQSRSYRAPEVILGLPYGPKIDIWSLGCILAELCSGQVLFQNDSLATLLARVVGIIGPIDPQLLKKGRERHKFFTRNHMLYERNPETEQLEYLIPKRTTLRHRVPMGDPGFIEFVSTLLTVDPAQRPTATEALSHPWLSHQYDTTV